MDYIHYINYQLHNLYPSSDFSKELDSQLLHNVKSEADERFEYLAKRVSILSRTGSDPDPCHIMKSPLYLYILARVLYEKNFEDQFNLKNRLYCLNKTLNGCSIYFKISLPKVFFINYASGVVLGDCSYGENLVVYQGVTVGGYRDKVPVLGDNVVLMPNAIVSGSTHLGNNVIVSSGVAVINKIIPDNTIVFNSANRESEIYMHRITSSSYIDYFINPVAGG